MKRYKCNKCGKECDVLIPRKYKCKECKEIMSEINIYTQIEQEHSSTSFLQLKTPIRSEYSYALGGSSKDDDETTLSIDGKRVYAIKSKDDNLLRFVRGAVQSGYSKDVEVQ